MKKTKIKNKRSKTGLLARMKEDLSGVAEEVGTFFGQKHADVVAAIEVDHNDLRNFLAVLKNTDENMKIRRRAYRSFSALLKSHSSAEQAAVYVPTMKLAGREMHVKVAEGYVEHRVANDLMKQMDTSKDALFWSAHANVLSESVEHHLREEERDLLPLIRKSAPAKLHAQMLKKFMALRKKTQKLVSKKNAGILGAN